MEKGTVDQIWKKVFFGCCGAAIVLLIPGLALQLSPALYLALGALAAAAFAVGLVLAIRGMRCPFCKKSVYHRYACPGGGALHLSQVRTEAGGEVDEC